jgi:serpin B
MLTEAKTLDNSSYNSAGEDAHAPTTAEIANTIYVNSGKGYELQQDFVEKANTFYNAQPEARDFYDGETWKVINQWASDHTHGMIPKVFSTEDDFNSDAVSYLLNAIYFKGAWTNPFDKSNTRDEAFNGGDKVPMMSQKEEFEYTENDLYQAVRLPYGNGAYLMTLFLPREGKTIGDVLAKMDGHNWQFKGEGGCQVDLKMPRFKTETGLKLAPIMSELGMPSAFSAEAEFPYFGNRPVFISDMFQKAVIDLDEEGTTAAAVTVIATAQSLPREVTFHANRPFFYVISEQSTGVIFFIGQYVGEGTTGSTHINKQTMATSTPAIYDLQGRRVGSPSGMKKGVYLVGGKKVVVR